MVDVGALVVTVAERYGTSLGQSAEFTCEKRGASSTARGGALSDRVEGVGAEAISSPARAAAILNLSGSRLECYLTEVSPEHVGIAAMVVAVTAVPLAKHSPQRMPQ